jgi:hypothetical protein
MRLYQPYRPLQQIESGQLHTSSVVTHLCTHPLQFVLPENIAHAFLTVLFLLCGQWMAFLLNAPLLAFNANKYVIST